MLHMSGGHFRIASKEHGSLAVSARCLDELKPCRQCGTERRRGERRGEQLLKRFQGVLQGCG
jgi:hypothetical protein